MRSKFVPVPILCSLLGCPLAEESSWVGEPNGEMPETTGMTTTGDGTGTGEVAADSSGTSSSSDSTSTSETATDASSASSGNDTNDTNDTNDHPESCDPWEQDCPPGEKCIAWANDGGPAPNDNKCSPIAPNPKQLGEACTTENPARGGDDCDIGLMCWGTCVALCAGTAEDYWCAPDDTMCVITNEGSLTLCLPTCDPLAQDCEVYESCLPHDNDLDSACITDADCFPMTANGGFVCVYSLDLGYAEPCSYVNECGAGLFCAWHGLVAGCLTEACCTEICDLSDPVCTGANMECVPLYEPNEAPEGYENVGGCMLP
jgi:hypothetical protein